MNTKIFARNRDDGNFDILETEDGDRITRLDLNEYPVGSQLSSRYEHPAGIIFTLEQVLKNSIEIE